MTKKFFSLALIIWLVLPFISLGIGQITEPIVFENATKGQELKTNLQLINPESRSTAYVLSADGDIETWVNFYSPQDPSTPVERIELAPKSNLEMPVKITVPLGTPNGKYQGQLIIMTAPEQNEQADKSVTVQLKIGRDVSITVTDEEVVKLESQIIPRSFAIKKNKPLEIKMIYDNQGNVSLKPAVELEILRGENSVFKAVFPYPDNQEPVKPLERKVIDPLISWQTTGQGPGEYQAKIAILLNGETAQVDDFKFRITSVKDNILAVVSKIGFGSLGLGWFLIGLLFLVIASNLILLSQKPSFFKRRNKKI